ncbi:MAG: AI-2E family transporter [Candidatus Uhrbacteria bacterium]
MASQTPSLPQTINVSTLTFVKVVLIAVSAWFLWYVRDIVAMLFVALLLAALIDPLADWFAKNKVPRAVAVIIVYLALGMVASVVTVLIVPVIIDQVTQLFGSGPFAAVLQQGVLKARTLFDVQNFLASLLSGQSTSVTSVFSQVAGFLSGFVALFVVLVLAFYMIVEEDAARKLFRSFAPVEYQPFIAQMIAKMQTKIGAWLRGQLLLGLIVGVCLFVGLVILNVKYALLLAVLAGLFEIIPYVGPTLSLIPAVIIGFVQSPVKGLAVLILYLVVQQLENHILVPKIMQKVTGLNPIVSIVALMVGVKLAGLVGAILSIPVATMVAVVLEDLFRTGDKT